MPTYSPSEVFRRVLEAHQTDIHTALPARVEKFDAVTQTIDAKPMIKRVIKDDDGTELEESIPVIRDVPVCFPRAGRFFVAFPLAKGDFVQLLFNERSIDQFFEKGSEVHPIDLSTHDFNGAVAYPGMVTKGTPLGEDVSTDLVIGDDGGAVVRILPDGTIEIGSTAGTKQAAALADSVKAELEGIKADFDAFKTAYNGHVHPGVSAGVASTSITAPVVLTYSPQDVGSTKVQVEE